MLVVLLLSRSHERTVPDSVTFAQHLWVKIEFVIIVTLLENIVEQLIQTVISITRFQKPVTNSQSFFTIYEGMMLI